MPIKITNTGSVVYNPRYVGPKQYTDQSTGRILNTVDSGVVAPYERTGIGTGGTEAPNPVSIVTRLKDSSTDGKTLPATKGSNATLKSINCLTFDGDNDHVDLVDLPQELFKTGVFEIELDILIDDSDTSYHRILQFYANNSAFWRLQKNTDSNTYQIWCRNSSGDQIYRDNNISFTADTLFHIKIVGDGTDVKVFHDDSLVDTLTITTANLESGTITYAEPSLGDASTSFKGQMSNFKVSTGSSNTLHTHLPLQEGVGVTAHDISGNGNHATIDGCTHTTLNGLTSNNHKNGFNDDIFLGYKGFWDETVSGSGTFTISEDNITLAGNTGTSGKIRQHVYGLVSGDTLVITGTVTQTGGGADNVAISSASAGFAESSVFISDGVGTNTFTKTFNANSSTCDIQLVAISSANFVLSDLKFTVVKKIPALNTKTKQVATFDGVADKISTGFTVPAFTTLTYTTRFKAHTLHQGLLVSNRDLANRFLDIQLETSGNITIKFSDGTYTPHTLASAYSADTLYDLTYTIQSSDSSGTVSIQEIGGSLNNFSFDSDRQTVLSSNDVRIGQENNSNILEFDGEMHSAKLVVDGSTKFEYDFQSDIGTTTVQDTTANNNDGTVTVGSGGTATFWGTRVADTTGSLVSANYRTGSTSVTNPANSNAIHNNSECSISFNSKSLAASSLSDFKNNVEPSLSGVWLNKTSDELVTELVEYGNYTIASSAATSAVNTKYFDGREI